MSSDLQYSPGLTIAQDRGGDSLKPSVRPSDVCSENARGHGNVLGWSVGTCEPSDRGFIRGSIGVGCAEPSRGDRSFSFICWAVEKN